MPMNQSDTFTPALFTIQNAHAPPIPDNAQPLNLNRMMEQGEG